MKWLRPGRPTLQDGGRSFSGKEMWLQTVGKAYLKEKAPALFSSTNEEGTLKFQQE